MQYSFKDDFISFIDQLTTTKFPWETYGKFHKIYTYYKSNALTVNSSPELTNVISIINSNFTTITNMYESKKLYSSQFTQLLNFFMDIDHNLYERYKKYVISRVNSNRTKHYTIFTSLAKYAGSHKYSITDFEDVLIDRFVQKDQSNKVLKVLPYTVLSFIRQVPTVNKKRVLKELCINGVSEYFVKNYIDEFPELAELAILI